MRPAVAEAERVAAVEVDLAHSQPLGELDPLVRVLLGDAVEVEQVRAAIDSLIQRPRPAQRRVGQLGRAGDRLLEDFAERGRRAPDQRDLGARHAESRVAGGAEPAAQARQLQDVGPQVQGQRAGGEGLVVAPAQCQRNVAQRELVDRLALHGDDFEHQVARPGVGLERGPHAGVAEGHLQAPLGRAHRRGGEFLAGLAHLGEGGGRGGAVVLARLFVDEVQVAAVAADLEAQVLGLKHARRSGFCPLQSGALRAGEDHCGCGDPGPPPAGPCSGAPSGAGRGWRRGCEVGRMHAITPRVREVRLELHGRVSLDGKGNQGGRGGAGFPAQATDREPRSCLPTGAARVNLPCPGRQGSTLGMRRSGRADRRREAGLPVVAVVRPARAIPDAAGRLGCDPCAIWSPGPVGKARVHRRVPEPFL